MDKQIHRRALLLKISTLIMEYSRSGGSSRSFTAEQLLWMVEVVISFLYLLTKQLSCFHNLLGPFVSLSLCYRHGIHVALKWMRRCGVKSVVKFV